MIAQPALQATPLILAASSADGELTGLVGWVANVIDTLGAIGVGLLTLAEVFFPPIPSEFVLPMAGYLAGRGRLGLAAALIASTIGATVGAVGLYWLARAWGIDRVRALLASMPLMEPSDLDRAEQWFARHDRAAVLIGRLVPGVRSLISLPAGFQQMPLGLFVLLTAVGSAAWNTLLLFGGYALGSQWRSIGRYSDWLNLAVVVVLIGAVGKFVWSRRDRISIFGG